MAKTLLLILNPRAGRTRSTAPLFDAVAHFCEAGYLVSVRRTTHPGHAAEIVEAEGADFDRIVCCGGDGTLNETVRGAMRLDAPPPLGYIPGGSTNDFAASLSLPADPVRAAQQITGSPGRRLDVGSLNGRPFVYVASFGAFTRSSYAAPQSIKNDLGHLAYILQGVRDLSSLRPYPAVVTTDDGLFELLLIPAPANAAQLQELIRCLILQDFTGSGIIFRHVPAVTVETPEGFPWTLDGEFGSGAERVEIQNLPRRLEFLL